jgi:glycosyltransferase involved in cell wall biosynthesis/GT2 family glycosyltransferase
LGGAEWTLLELLDSPQARARLDLSFLLLGRGPLEAELKKRGYDYAVRSLAPRPDSVVRAVASLLLGWRRNPPDVVFANGVKAATVALPAARLAGVRAVWYKVDFSHDRRLAALLGRMADRVLAISPEVAAATRRQDVVLIPPPRPTGPATRERAVAQLAAHGFSRNEGLTVAIAGRLVSYKGVDDVIRALAHPRSQGWRLAVIGGDDPTEPAERRRLDELARTLGVDARVSFLGEVEDVGRLLAAFDAVAVVTRRTEDGFGREGYGRIAAEAMTAGVPLIATQGGGILARVGEAGIVVPESAPEQIAEALAALTDPSLREAMGSAGRALAAAEPGADEVTALVLQALAETACRPGAGLERQVPISVVTTVMNEGAEIDRLLDSLQPQLGADDELIVVDGGSQDSTADRVLERAANDQRIRLINAPGAGISRGRNEGIARARHPVIACTDAGCDPWPGWLAAFRRAFAERKPADLVTGVYEVSHGNAFSRSMAISSYPCIDEARHPRPLVRLYGRLFGRMFEPTMPTGRSVAFSAEAWRAVGGFPELLATAEDVSFGRSIARAGRRCILSCDAGVRWRQRSSIVKTGRMYFAYGRGGARSVHLRVGARDLARALAYPLIVAALVWGTLGLRITAGVAGAGYMSLPLARALRARESPTVIALLPVALAVKDVSKAAGYIAGCVKPPRTSP